MRALPILLALLLASAGALAQDASRSEEFNEGYRRGYQEGFRDGLRQAQEEAARGAAAAATKPTGPITVSNATYGTSSRSCNATHWLARRVNGRRSASVEVSNSICGDPSPGDRKSLEASYICGSVAKTASAYEHRTLYLDCTS